MTNEAIWAVQILETCKAERDAYAALDFLLAQDGCMGGRVFRRDELWHAQAFYPDCGPQYADNLPDGARRVIILPCQREQLGIITERDAS